MNLKLNKRGVSLSFALVFLLVVIMLSMVLITAATASVANVRAEKTQQQVTLTVTSAARRLATAIEATTVTVPPDGSTPTEAGDLKDLLRAAFDSAGTAQNLTLREANGNIPEDVTASLTMNAPTAVDDPNDVFVSLALATDAQGGINYQVTFRVDGHYDEATGVYFFSGVTYYSGSEAY